jgi:hypothetical protein
VDTPQVIDGGWRVKASDDGRHYIDVMPMLFNYRVVTTPVVAPWLLPARHWCYAGKGHGALLRAMAAAMAWSGADGTEPLGWNKNGQTGAWVAPTGHTGIEVGT